MTTKWQPSGNQTETQYRLGKDSVVKDYVVMKDKIKHLFKTLHPDCELEIDKYINANTIQIGRIIEANCFSSKGYKEVLENISLYLEIAENYGEAKVEIINELEEKEYREIFNRIQIVMTKINSTDIINVRAFVSSYISKRVNKHLLEKGELSNNDRIEYQW